MGAVDLGYRERHNLVMQQRYEENPVDNSAELAAKLFGICAGLRPTGRVISPQQPARNVSQSVEHGDVTWR
jgi:hypothetical protein